MRTGHSIGTRDRAGSRADELERFRHEQSERFRHEQSECFP